MKLCSTWQLANSDRLFISRDEMLHLDPITVNVRETYSDRPFEDGVPIGCRSEVVSSSRYRIECKSAVGVARYTPYEAIVANGDDGAGNRRAMVRHSSS